MRVVALWPGATAEHVERYLVVPLELAFGGMPGLDHVDSASRPGAGELRLAFKPATDRAAARAEVNARLQVATLPSDVEPMIAPDGRRAAVRFALDSASLPLVELRRLVDWELRRAALTVPGVVEATSCGGARRRIDVWADEARMAATGVTVADLRAALAPERVALGVRSAESPDELGLRRVAVRSGAPVLVRDLARVEIDAAPPDCLATLDGVGQSVVGQVIARDGADVRAVAAAVQTRLSAAPLPPSVHLRLFGGEDETRWRIALPAGARPDDVWRLVLMLRHAAGSGADASPPALAQAGLRADEGQLDPAPGEAQVIVSSSSASRAAEIDRQLRAIPGVAILDVDGTAGDSLRARVVRVTGPDLASLRRAAQAVAASLGGAAVDGAAEAPSVEVVPDRAALARYGLNVAELEQSVEAATIGSVVGSLRAAADSFDIVLHAGKGDDRAEALRTVTLAAPDGSRIPLSTVAAITATTQPAVILRHDGRRCIRLYARLPSSASLPSVPLPPDVTIEWE
ncbi:MAG TPA: efflux RND transporter permease subunit [Polyangia bacterium]|nr:efflux RND transporter permease subunit [Polyangia bacterium]